MAGTSFAVDEQQDLGSALRRMSHCVSGLKGNITVISRESQLCELWEYVKKAFFHTHDMLLVLPSLLGPHHYHRFFEYGIRIF